MFGITAKRKGYGIDWYWRGRYRGTFGHSPVPYVIIRKGNFVHIFAWIKLRIRHMKRTRADKVHATP